MRKQLNKLQNGSANGNGNAGISAGQRDNDPFDANFKIEDMPGIPNSLLVESMNDIGEVADEFMYQTNQSDSNSEIASECRQTDREVVHRINNLVLY